MVFMDIEKLLYFGIKLEEDFEVIESVFGLLKIFI